MKEWEVLSDNEEEYIWKFILENYKFNPKYNSKDKSAPFLILPEPYAVYEMHLFTSYLKDTSINIDEEYYNNFNELITNIFIKCMGKDEYIFALDWQHTCFKYNPNSSEKMSKVLELDGFNIYFPEFYPDGDYYIFISNNFSWGYFTHPWTQELWVFGNELINEINNIPQVYLSLKIKID